MSLSFHFYVYLFRSAQEASNGDELRIEFPYFCIKTYVVTLIRTILRGVSSDGF